MKRALLILLLALPAACGSSDQGVGGVSPEEAKALNEAAAKIDGRMENISAPASRP
jgi:hypothetical protein